MAGLVHGVNALQRVLKSIDLTYDRSASEGFDGTDDGMECLKEFVETLLKGGEIDTFLSGQDMVVPDTE